MQSVKLPRDDIAGTRRIGDQDYHAAMGTQGFATVPHTEPRPVREPGPGQDGLYGIASTGSSDSFWLCWLPNPRLGW